MNRDVVLVIYAAALGWVACSWWRAERQRLEYEAQYAARAEVLAMKDELRTWAAPTPEPAT